MRITELLQSSVAGADPVSSTTFKISREYDGQQRRLYVAKCAVCKGIFWAPRHARKKFCSIECRGIADRNRIALKCAKCGCSFERKEAHVKHATKGFHFCSRKCKDEAQQIGGISEIQPANYKGGIWNYRERAFRAYGKKCFDCGYDAYEQMLDVDHEDGNRENGAIENLKPRCVWCHALKTRRVPKHERA